jgi:hypothetical protein
VRERERDNLPCNKFEILTLTVKYEKGITIVMACHAIQLHKTYKILQLQLMISFKKENLTSDKNFEIICQVEVFWVVMLYSTVVEYQHFRGPCCV